MKESADRRVWQLHTAKAAEDFDRLEKAQNDDARSAFDIFAPLVGSGLEVTRSRERGRRVDL